MRTPLTYPGASRVVRQDTAQVAHPGRETPACRPEEGHSVGHAGTQVPHSGSRMLRYWSQESASSRAGQPEHQVPAALVVPGAHPPTAGRRKLKGGELPQSGNTTHSSRVLLFLFLFLTYYFIKPSRPHHRQRQ